MNIIYKKIFIKKTKRRRKEDKNREGTTSISSVANDIA